MTESGSMDARGGDARPRPVLQYVEYHLVEHCNLACNRCGHFSPLAAKSEADPLDFERDLRQLAVHFANIDRIHLLGGEPLLHPTPEAFIRTAREVFPKTDLHIFTNGTRLKAMRQSFWEACRRAGVSLDISLYPVMAKARPVLEQLCRDQGVALTVHVSDHFYAWLNPSGDSDRQSAMTNCRRYFYCPFLKDSRLYVCSLPATAEHYNRKFGASIIADPGIDIFDPKLNGWQILYKLNKPVETCRFCSCNYDLKPWESIREHRAEDYASGARAEESAPAS